jgi:hypothetical protein
VGLCSAQPCMELYGVESCDPPPPKPLITPTQAISGLTFTISLQEECTWRRLTKKICMWPNLWAADARQCEWGLSFVSY